jgi:hypothetical protein
MLLQACPPNLGKIKHDRYEDEEKGQIKNQGDGGARDEFADILYAAQAGRDDTCGSSFKVSWRQFQQVFEHCRSQDGIDAIAGMQHQVLPHPGE